VRAVRVLTRLLTADVPGIMEGARVVRDGGLVAYPTDTVYGLGCDPFDHQAVLRLVGAKGRSLGGLPVLVHTFERAREIGNLDEVSLLLAQRFWPGPLTLVVPARVPLPPQVTGPSNTVGLRIPNRMETLELVRLCGGAIVGTSANITGHSPPKSAGEVQRDLEGRINLVLDGGPATLGIESTVVRVDNGEVVILRERAVSKKEISDALVVGPVLER
jgi:L-threonylcarbamoyladenylate synthase